LSHGLLTVPRSPIDLLEVLAKKLPCLHVISFRLQANKAKSFLTGRFRCGLIEQCYQAEARSSTGNGVL
jgi:hypothetical protein